VTLLSCDAFVPSSSLGNVGLKHYYSSQLTPHDDRLFKSKLEMVSFSKPMLSQLSSRIRRKRKDQNSNSRSVRKTWGNKIRNAVSHVKTRVHSTRSSPRSHITKAIKLFLVPLFLISTGVSFAPLKAVAMAAGGGVKGPVAPMKREEIFASVSLFLVLFMVLSMLHAAEIAITTLYPWKVKEFAEEEEKLGNKRGVFKTLNQDITRVLTTILVTSTASSIYGKG